MMSARSSKQKSPASGIHRRALGQGPQAGDAPHHLRRVCPHYVGIGMFSVDDSLPKRGRFLPPAHIIVAFLLLYYGGGVVGGGWPMGNPDFAARSRDAILAFPDGEKASCTGYIDVPPPAIAWPAAWLLGRVQRRDYTTGRALAGAVGPGTERVSGLLAALLKLFPNSLFSFHASGQGNPPGPPKVSLRDDDSCRLDTHTHTRRVTLTPPQPIWRT